MSGLKRNPRNLVQALGFIPRTMRLIPLSLNPVHSCQLITTIPSPSLSFPLALFLMTRYVHSYQSYLWNHAASHRIKTYGDLVLCSLPAATAAATAASAAAAAAAGRAAGVGAEGPGMRGTDAEAEAEEAAAVAVEARAEGEEVRVVSEEEAEKGVYSIDQVVLPLPGHISFEAPQDPPSTTGLHRPLHQQAQRQRIPGGYRRLLQRPSDYNWRVLAYWRPTQVLAETDLDRIAAAALASPHAPAAPGPTPPTSAAAPASATPAVAADSSSAAAAGAAGTDAPPPPAATASGDVGTPPPAPAAATASGDAAATSGSDAPAVVEAAHVYYGFKQPGYKGALKQAQRGEEKAGVTAGGAALSGVEAATGEAGAGGEAAGAVPAVVVLASSDGVRLGRDELERLGIGEGPIGALVEGGDGEEGGPERGEAEAGVATEDGEKAEGIVESEMENGNEDGGDEKEKVKQGEKDAGAGSGEGKEQAAGRRGERGVEGAAQEDVRVALQVEFTLPASGYATMAIRELLKASTAAGVHKVFNDREDSRG
ncbi:unnamed protein product [Closterium sp. NIES-54]